MDTIKSDGVVEAALLSGNNALGRDLDGEVIAIDCALTFGLDDAVRDEVEAIKENGSELDKLVVMLETTGGYIEVVERIVSVFRRHFSEVVFVIPGACYSAGTVLALSGDDIFMDYYSVLGPIDPQFQTDGGDQVPGMGYLQKFSELSKKINDADPSELDMVRAETAFY